MGRPSFLSVKTAYFVAGVYSFPQHWMISCSVSTAERPTSACLKNSSTNFWNLRQWTRWGPPCQRYGQTLRAPEVWPGPWQRISPLLHQCAPFKLRLVAHGDRVLPVGDRLLFPLNKLVCDEPVGKCSLSLQEHTEEALGGLPIPSLLEENVDGVPILVDRPPGPIVE